MKQLIAVDPETGERTVLATYRLRDGKVLIEVAECARGLFWFGDIYHAASDCDVTTDDGELYLDALGAQYAHSTFAGIVTVPDDGA